MSTNITVNEINKEIKTLKDEIGRLCKQRDSFELDPDKYEKELIESLNGIYGKVSVCGYDYYSGDLLKQIDPIAFRQELLAYVDNIDLREVEEYQEILDSIDYIECRLFDLDIELEELYKQESQIESEEVQTK